MDPVDPFPYHAVIWMLDAFFWPCWGTDSDDLYSNKQEMSLDNNNPWGTTTEIKLPALPSNSNNNNQIQISIAGADEESEELIGYLDMVANLILSYYRII